MEITNKINKNIFREYDIRGVYDKDLNEDVAYTIGKSFGTYIKRRNINETIIGFDNRISSPILSNALIKGILSTGVNVINLGLVTTPMYYYARKFYHLETGIMITASHNPKEYNGYKVYGQDGAQMSPEDTQVVVDYINKIDDYFSCK